MTWRINRYRCSHCGCDEPILNAIDGKLYCNNCGRILEGSSRKSEKEHGHTANPIPCTKGFEDWTVKDYFQKINEELDEMKEEIYMGQVRSFRKARIAEEAADTITAITSMLQAMGIDERHRQEAQERVNERNKERGRI